MVSIVHPVTQSGAISLLWVLTGPISLLLFSSTRFYVLLDNRLEEKLSKHIDIGLMNKAIFTDDAYEREYYTIRLMRKGKRLPVSTEDLFVPARYKIS